MMEPTLSTHRTAAVAARLSVALACASLFTACGGGDEAAPAPVPPSSRILTAATEPRLTSQSVELLARVSAAWADVTATAAPARATARLKAGALAGVDGFAQAQAVQQTSTDPCLLGGTQTLSYNYASKTESKVGDYSSTAFTDCRVNDHTVLNGLTKQTLVALTDTTETWERLATDFATLTDDVLWRESGTSRVATETPAATATGQKLSVNLDGYAFFHSKGGVRHADYTVTGTATADVNTIAQTYAATVTLKVTGNLMDVGTLSWRIETPTPLQGSTSVRTPSGGTVKLKLEDGSSVTLTPAATGVRVVTDFNGDGKAEVDVNRTWAQIAAGL